MTNPTSQLNPVLTDYNVPHARRSGPARSGIQLRVLQRPARAWQQRRVKAVGNSEAMAATPSLTQVTRASNSNTTTTIGFRPLPGPLRHVSGAIARPGGQKSSHGSLFVSLFFKFSPAVTGKSFCLSLFGDCVRA